MTILSKLQGGHYTILTMLVTMKCTKVPGNTLMQMSTCAYLMNYTEVPGTLTRTYANEHMCIFN